MSAVVGLVGRNYDSRVPSRKGFGDCWRRTRGIGNLASSFSQTREAEASGTTDLINNVDAL